MIGDRIQLLYAFPHTSIYAIFERFTLCSCLLSLSSLLSHLFHYIDTMPRVQNSDFLITISNYTPQKAATRITYPCRTYPHTAFHHWCTSTQACPYLSGAWRHTSSHLWYTHTVSHKMFYLSLMYIVIDPLVLGKFGYNLKFLIFKVISRSSWFDMLWISICGFDWC